MEQRALGRTGARASVIGVGTWQFGTDWGDVPIEDAHALLRGCVDSGVTFVDTADVYGDGRSERFIGSFVNALDEAERPFVATKMGRRVEQRPENYTEEAFLAWNDRSRENLGVDTLDLVQLHCPPTEVLADPATWDALDRMVDEGRIRHYGASVETCEQALLAMERGASTIQIIINLFRRKPLEEVLPAAIDRGVGIIVRVPLASGLLSGRYTRDTSFAACDHRTYNRDGSAFDIGETFSGVPYEVGVDAAAEFTRLCAEFGPEGAAPAQIALKWITQLDGVTTVIPGARNLEQAAANAAAAALPPLSDDFEAALADLYDRRIRAHVHDRW
ncbi:aldo/keto reductase [Actinomyces sp. B33]|uniref:aldo/keto reductase n=1 Tax=Actinomyces sp. B33 TaxID=2942131 RepID=UPI00234107BB|nr:aldo/keto reductase [Actinomyces sp. B33]MDC4232971.1 aldo/keto reductase [Actinomyces sp. B33]